MATELIGEGVLARLYATEGLLEFDLMGTDYLKRHFELTRDQDYFLEIINLKTHQVGASGLLNHLYVRRDGRIELTLEDTDGKEETYVYTMDDTPPYLRLSKFNPDPQS
jgi:hypothetical protein